MTAADLLDDFDLFDDAHTVTVESFDLEGTTTALVSVLGLKRATRGSVVHLAAGMEVVVDVARWHLKAEGGLTSPRRGTRITSGTYGVWEVIDDDAETFACRFACNAKRIPAA